MLLFWRHSIMTSCMCPVLSVCLDAAEQLTWSHISHHTLRLQGWPWCPARDKATYLSERWTACRRRDGSLLTDYWWQIIDRLLTDYWWQVINGWVWQFVFYPMELIVYSSSLCIFVDGLILISSSLTKLCNSNMLSKYPISLKLTSNEYISNNRFER